MRKLWMLLTLGLSACVAVPQGVTVVEDFNVQRFSGQWYEIVRLDHRFEQGLSQVSATYSIKTDGSIQVINRGYNASKARWQQAEGTARFVDSPQRGALKVSFFGPFYASYNVIALDPDYQWALIAGPDRSYLWLLARQPTLPQETREAILAKAGNLGFPLEKLQEGQ